jgi:hypothetical protein
MAKEPVAKEPINRMLNNTTLTWSVILHLQVREKCQDGEVSVIESLDFDPL